jgi:hypothetical protein
MSADMNTNAVAKRVPGHLQAYHTSSALEIAYSKHPDSVAAAELKVSTVRREPQVHTPDRVQGIPLQ